MSNTKHVADLMKVCSILPIFAVMPAMATEQLKVTSNLEMTEGISNGEFTASINTPKEDGSFELPDGDYNVTVTEQVYERSNNEGG